MFTKRPPGSGLTWRKRVLILLGLVLAIFVLGHFGVKYLLWPQIEKSKASVEKLLSARIGADVSMDDLQVSWTGIRPAFEIDGLRLHKTEQTKPLLQIEKIRGELSWKSFYHLAPYFHEIYFEGAQIYAQRNSKGLITIAGIPVAQNSDDHSAENWLFDQNIIEVSNATLFWDDQKNKKPITSVEVLKLSLSNGIRRHKGSVSATTPWTKGPTEVSINFAPRLGGQAGNWRDWIGNISWNLSDLDLKQISKEFQLGLNTLEGTLSTKGTLKIDNAQPDGGEFYVAADNLVIQHSKSEDAIALGRLETNLSQETNDGLISISTKSFAWRDMGSSKSAPLENLSPMTFRWKPPGEDGEIKEFGFSSPKISVEDVVLFAANLPLSKKVHQWIKDSHAEGDLEDLDIHWSESKSHLSALKISSGLFGSNKLDFSVNAKLINLSFVGVNKAMPSVFNLSGYITSTQNEGSFSLNSKNIGVEIFDLLEEPKIQLDTASGQIQWAKQRGNWVISTKKLALSNPEITTNLAINYIIGNEKDPDFMTLDMSFDQAKLKTAHKYLPVGMGKEARLYLSKAFDAGQIQNGGLHIKGNPNQVPFAKASLGEFTLNLPVVGASFSPVPLLPKNQGTWSTFSNVNGNVVMNNANLTVDINKASFKEIALSNFHAEIPSVSANQPWLTVSGNAQGQAIQMLEYFFVSPVGLKQGNLEKNLRVSGPVDLNLGLKTPLSGSADTNVDIKLTLPGNKAQWASLPPFENLKGKIRITETNPEFENISADFLGGLIRVTSTNQEGSNQNFNIAGDVQANFLKQYFSGTLNPKISRILSSMSGSLEYAGNINFNKLGSELNLKFDLKNWASSAPMPVKKLAGSSMSGQFNLKSFPNNKSNPNRLVWSGKIGEIYAIQGVLTNNDEIRNSLGIGGVTNLPALGLNFNLVSNELNLDAWLDFFGQQKTVRSKEVEQDLNNVQVTAQVKKLIALDRTWQDLNLVANSKKNAWDLRLTSPQVAGQIQLQEPNQNQTSALVTGRLSRLKIPDTNPSPANKANEVSKAASFNINSIPGFDLMIDDFSWSKAQLGQLKIKTRAVGNVLKIDSIQTSNPQGTTIISGQWIGSAKNTSDHSTINIDMNIKDAGQIIARWSSQKSVEGGQGKLTANVEWDGAPYDPKYDTLSGKLNLNLENGRLLEVNSSGAKILDVLSLQSLFRFATLDLQGNLGNIVTKGTPFNSVNTNFEISNGIAQTKQFNMNLDQARVAMSGQINIPKQTQDLRITIFPTIDATAGSLAAFAINPIVGLGALVGQYLITNQINRNLQADYLVQGSWGNPEVIPLDQKGQPVDAKTLDSIRSKGLLKEQTKPGSSTSPSSSPSSNTSTINKTLI
ncbi:YhdP family protein [Polynucleobacter necessarius]|uniref:YhdP family protein n=1 Tax=Polynucleobacter necessarius TaxID=576610 RepID=UPI001E2F3E2D|nr:YhdP family protein [Polynucleobacter necessarius]